MNLKSSFYSSYFVCVLGAEYTRGMACIQKSQDKFKSQFLPSPVWREIEFRLWDLATSTFYPLGHLIGPNVMNLNQ